MQCKEQMQTMSALTSLLKKLTFLEARYASAHEQGKVLCVLHKNNSKHFLFPVLFFNQVPNAESNRKVS